MRWNMNKFTTSVQCPDCCGTGLIIIKDDYITYKQCHRCCGFGTILVIKDGDKNET